VGTAALVAVDVALVLVVAGALRRLLIRVHQPPVMADIFAGLVLGATLLGTLPGDLPGRLFTPEARSVLGTLGEIAIVAYLFATAARFDRAALGRERRIVGAVAVGSFVVPWLAGAALAVAVHGSVAGDPPLVPFALFLGTALAVTAVPVLARIIDERRLDGRPAARIALAAAGAQELVVWPALALAVAGTASSPPAGVLVLAGLASVVAVVVLARLGGAAIAGAPRAVAGIAVLVMLGLAATATELAGLHLFVGALLFGVALPAGAREAALSLLDAQPLRLARFVCLPLFFALPALKVDVWGLGAEGLWLFAAVLFVAVIAKLGSAFLSALRAGAARDDALTVGALMNARGLVELVVLAVGLEAGLIDQRLFSVMVLMALVTTLATGPLADRIDRSRGTAAADGAPRPASSPQPSTSGRAVALEQSRQTA
jgi:Kef-type K+ transport system membrane component KefB